MRRSVLKIICIVSGILFVILSILVISSIAQAFEEMSTVSIIGGASTPTMGFFLRKVLGSPVFYAAMAAFLLFAGTGLALIFCKRPQK